MNTALKEALQTIPKDHFNSCSSALLDFKETFGGENGVNNEKWLIMPRQFLRSAARFSLPINTQKLATLTAFEYLSQYVWISDHRKHLYRFVFNKYVCEASNDLNIENDNDDELERDTPSHATQEKSIQAYIFQECVMAFNELINAFTNVLGYCGPIEQMAEKINKIIHITRINEHDQSTINFRSWCGLVAFAERYLNNLPFEEDPCDEVILIFYLILIKLETNKTITIFFFFKKQYFSCVFHKKKNNFFHISITFSYIVLLKIIINIFFAG